MKIELVKQLPYGDKKNLVKDSCLIYRKMEEITTANEENLELQDIIQERLDQAFKRKTMFESLLEVLSTPEREIIVNDFIWPRETGWYKEKYSKNHYYEIKNDAIDKFLALMYV